MRKKLLFELVFLIFSVDCQNSNENDNVTDVKNLVNKQENLYNQQLKTMLKLSPIVQQIVDDETNLSKEVSSVVDRAKTSTNVNQALLKTDKDIDSFKSPYVQRLILVPQYSFAKLINFVQLIDSEYEIIQPSKTQIISEIQWKDKIKNKLVQAQSIQSFKELKNQIKNYNSIEEIDDQIKVVMDEMERLKKINELTIEEAKLKGNNNDIIDARKRLFLSLQPLQRELNMLNYYKTNWIEAHKE